MHHPGVLLPRACLCLWSIPFVPHSKVPCGRWPPSWTRHQLDETSAHSLSTDKTSAGRPCSHSWPPQPSLQLIPSPPLRISRFMWSTKQGHGMHMSESSRLTPHILSCSQKDVVWVLATRDISRMFSEISAPRFFGMQVAIHLLIWIYLEICIVIGERITVALFFVFDH